MERKEILGYDAVRSAAKDFDTYSSDLLGDRDVRSYDSFHSRLTHRDTQVFEVRFSHFF